MIPGSVPLSPQIFYIAAQTSKVLLQVDGKVVNGQAVMFAYLGLSAGDLLSGLLSQWMKSRKKVVMLYLGFSVLVT